jgi:hypothetical protein
MRPTVTPRRRFAVARRRQPACPCCEVIAAERARLELLAEFLTDRGLVGESAAAKNIATRLEAIS